MSVYEYMCVRREKKNFSKCMALIITEMSMDKDLFFLPLLFVILMGFILIFSYFFLQSFFDTFFLPSQMHTYSVPPKRLEF